MIVALTPAIPDTVILDSIANVINEIMTETVEFRNAMQTRHPNDCKEEGYSKGMGYEVGTECL